MIKLVPRFTRADIEAMILDRKRRIREVIVLALKRAGEEFIRDARENGSYRDQTGNLRSSVGYLILEDGQVLFSDFSSAFKGKRGSDGPAQAKKVAEEVAGKFKSGFVLIGVAGMNYAAAVESKGYDVITSSAITAEKSLERAIKRIQSKIPNIK